MVREAQIHVLDQSTINQIAAGEVIERPASVVKELLENAIDAGATAVTIEIRDGGTSFIRITDNGCGIQKEQISLAFLRHSTSKIESADDLLTINSLGFRGEALSSIAAVSQVELVTKTADSLTGVSYQIEGGKELSFEEIGAPDGTTFLIRNLFFNTPARKKFLKSNTTEANYIAELVERIALSHPQVSIRLIINGQNKLHTTGNHQLKDLIYTIYGREIANNLTPVSAGNGSININGFLGKPLIARGNRSFENYFVNNRYIKSTLIARAIELAYKPFMMQHRYPFTVLQIEVPTDMVDINVHPTKMEVRFKDEEAVFNCILNILRDALAEKEFIPDVTLVKEPAKEAEKVKIPKGPEPFEHKRVEAEHKHDEPERSNESGTMQKRIQTLKDMGQSGRPHQTYTPSSTIPHQASPQTQMPHKSTYVRESAPRYDSQPVTAYEQVRLTDDKLLSKEARPKHQLIGQAFDTYWILQYEDKLYIMDQHAAHEKVLYETMVASYRKKERLSQMVAPSIILTLQPTEAAVLKEYETVFYEMGFEIEPYGGKEYAVRAVPANLYGVNDKDLLTELFAGLESNYGIAAPDRILERLATMSCKAAVKGNNKLSFAEANALLDQLLLLENPYACPHGRPTMIAMTKYELEKKFKRIV